MSPEVDDDLELFDQSVGRGTLPARLSDYGGWYDRRDTHRYRGKSVVDLGLVPGLVERTSHDPCTASSARRSSRGASSSPPCTGPV